MKCTYAFCIALLQVTTAVAAEVPDEARSLYDSVVAVTEIETSAKDQEAVIREFDEAIRLAQSGPLHEKQITPEEALAIFGSLTDSSKWELVGGSNFYKWWVKRLYPCVEPESPVALSGRTICMEWVSNARTGAITSEAALVGSQIQIAPFRIKFLISFFGWCGPDCDAGGQYIFEIVTRQRVTVAAVEYTPAVGGVEEQWHPKSFEYHRK